MYTYIKNYFPKRDWSRRLWIVAFCLQLFTFQCQYSTCYAQEAGDIITGTVTDDFGPIMMANVVELDASNRIVASTQTDINGNFSFKVKNPKDKLRISYVGYKNATFPINKMSYSVVLQSDTQINEVTVIAKQRTQGSGLSIPIDEISTARQSID
ncbi:MAG: carboxypeptidase-like regulatory domain-containing protein, partial [Prevotella sp.]|nr:carboxypeptidase-like regulatory domain-containing protein [Prevotella sp.]